MGFLKKLFGGKKKEEEAPKFDAKQSDDAKFKLELKMNEFSAKMERDQARLNSKLDEFNSCTNVIARNRIMQEGQMIQQELKDTQVSWQRTFNQYKTAAAMGRFATTGEELSSLESISVMTAAAIESAGAALVARAKQFDQEQASAASAVDTVNEALNRSVYVEPINSETFETQAAEKAAQSDAVFLENAEQPQQNTPVNAFEVAAEKRKVEQQ